MDLNNVMFKIEDGIAFVTINRPKVLNALNSQVLKELDYVFNEIACNEVVKGIVLSGAGDKAFVAGADISEFSELSVEEARMLSLKGQKIFKKLEDLSVVSIAIIDGFALGGGLELAMSCTFRYGTAAATVGQPEVKLGLIPGYAGTQRLTRLIGHSKAMEICMTGRMVKAEEALQIGILDRIVESDPVLEAVKSINKIFQNSPIAVNYCKKAILEGKELPFDAATRLESDLFAMCFATADMKEGVSAFLEKRTPEFKGK
jgi:enoyl-CoA hydratase